MELGAAAPVRRAGFGLTGAHEGPVTISGRGAAVIGKAKH